ncbi:DNA-3-methyladenine glycosylase [Salinicoccus halitifaciens]|uniref:Putative 3-methyladenine DNA glycosylase n=1 Tax=Salinicoccus halitifaciens TaxID=1073415 RepID=A0ABV2EAN7_9STAP|nr:DNA-3-methyladenine glycosylase [Salinicoccus halitifaciens]MCD2137671.1 DNA-3-methyladenine glycosylase [Salinicoccus halitifaciens]
MTDKFQSDVDISFLKTDTLNAAKRLLGLEIITRVGDEVTSGFITEVEAYLGVNDKAAHTFGGRRNKKNEMMYKPYGHIYVYTMHGHNCMNFLTTEGEPEGILIRAVEPNMGIDVMKERRGRDINLTDGPGKLTKSLGITRGAHNGMELNNDVLIVRHGRTPGNILATPRIGIDNKEEAVDYPYRFIVEGNPHVSRFKGKAAANKGWK